MRVTWLVPIVGERDEELLELPLMLLVSYLVAQFILHRFLVVNDTTALAIGGLALLAMLPLDFSLVPGLRGLSVGEYVSSRDPVAFLAYLCSLLLFPAMPLIARRCHHSEMTDGPT